MSGGTRSPIYTEKKKKKCVRSFGRLFSEIAQPLGVESVLCVRFLHLLFLASRHGRFIAFKILPVTASSTFDYFLDDAFADDEKAILKKSFYFLLFFFSHPSS